MRGILCGVWCDVWVKKKKDTEDCEENKKIEKEKGISRCQKRRVAVRILESGAYGGLSCCYARRVSFFFLCKETTARRMQSCCVRR